MLAAPHRRHVRSVAFLADKAELVADKLALHSDPVALLTDNLESCADTSNDSHDMDAMIGQLTLDARRVLSLNQRTLAEFLGLSSRTVQRWDARQSLPTHSDLHKLAHAVHPLDPELAARLAKAGSSSLEEVGIARPPESSPPAARAYDLAHLADGVVCAAADSMSLTPNAIRPALVAAFRRARQMHLTVEDMENALSPKEQPAERKKQDPKKR